MLKDESVRESDSQPWFGGATRRHDRNCLWFLQNSLTDRVKQNSEINGVNKVQKQNGSEREVRQTKQEERKLRRSHWLAKCKRLLATKPEAWNMCKSIIGCAQKFKCNCWNVSSDLGIDNEERRQLCQSVEETICKSIVGKVNSKGATEST